MDSKLRVFKTCFLHSYVQFKEYVGFVEAMNAFRGMKMVHKEIDKNLAANIHVDFDKTKHLSDISIRRRQIVRDRLIEKDRAAEEDEKKRLQAEEEKKEKEKLDIFHSTCPIFNLTFFRFPENGWP
jgi:splicing factor, arginine/serine-rich 17